MARRDRRAWRIDLDPRLQTIFGFATLLSIIILPFVIDVWAGQNSPDTMRPYHPWKYLWPITYTGMAGLYYWMAPPSRMKVRARWVLRWLGIVG